MRSDGGRAQCVRSHVVKRHIGLPGTSGRTAFQPGGHERQEPARNERGHLSSGTSGGSG